MKTIIFVPTKGPHRFRLGPRRWHDWIVQCRKAAQLQRTLPDAVIYIPSAVHTSGYIPELAFYRAALEDVGLAETVEKTADGGYVFLDLPGRIRAILEAEGLETMGQCLLAFALAERERAELIVLSTFPHILRVLYLCRGRNVQYKIAWGTPNPIEAITDILLAVVFPFFDFLGQGEQLRQWVIQRREKGKHI